MERMSPPNKRSLLRSLFVLPISVLVVSCGFSLDNPPKYCNSDNTIDIQIPYSDSGSLIGDAFIDADCYKFTLNTAQYVTMSTNGSTDTFGSLYTSSNGRDPIAFDENGGGGVNFLIGRPLNSGTYYLVVIIPPISTIGFSGPYALNVAYTLPCSSNDFTSISSIPYTSPQESISPAGDRDCFMFTLSAERRVTMETEGSTDTLGRLYTSSGSLIEENDDSGMDNNFKISSTLSPGVYYVEVLSLERDVTGPYIFRISDRAVFFGIIFDN